MLLLFRYPLHPHVTAVAHKRSRSFCQECKWQVTVKHVCAWCMVVSVWCTQNLRLDSSSFMWHQPCQRCKYTTSSRWIFKNALLKASHSCRITCKRSESARERRVTLSSSSSKKEKKKGWGGVGLNKVYLHS